MISFQDYRIAIGCFLGKAQFSSFISKKQEVLNKAKRKQNNSKFKSTRGDIDTFLSKPRVCEWRKAITTMSLICISVMLALVVRLIIDGDIESNPGPTYVIEKVIYGSYHKGDQRFGNTAGVQCACNSLYALCWSQIKKVNSWNTSDLDHILTKGDKFYKTLNTFDMLSVEDLPRFVKMYDQNVQIEFLELETKLARLSDGDPFLRNIIPNSDNVLFLLFMGGNTTAIMSLQNFFYVFDSHSRDERGLNIPNGRSVLLMFRYIFKLRSIYR